MKVNDKYADLAASIKDGKVESCTITFDGKDSDKILLAEYRYTGEKGYDNCWTTSINTCIVGSNSAYQYQAISEDTFIRYLRGKLSVPEYERNIISVSYVNRKENKND